MPEICAIVVNYASPDETIRCVSALPPGIDAVVVDNASPDDSLTRLAFGLPGVRVLAQPENAGFGAGVNAGVEAVHAEFLIVLNPDALPRPGALELLVQHLESAPECALTAPTLLDDDGQVQPSFYRRRPKPLSVFLDLCAPAAYLIDALGLDHPSLVPRDQIRPGLRVAFAMGAAMAVRRSAFVAAGGFDEDYFLYFEEVDLQDRLRRAGSTVAAVPDAVVEHSNLGGPERPAPSPHWFVGARQYLLGRGFPAWRADLALWAGLRSGEAGLRVMALLLPRHRTDLRRRAVAYRELRSAAPLRFVPS